MGSMSRKSYLPTLKKETLQGGHERPSRPTDHLCASREPGSDEAHGHPPPVHRGDSLLHDNLFKNFLQQDYFENFDGSQYLPRPWLRTVYPRD